MPPRSSKIRREEASTHPGSRRLTNSSSRRPSSRRSGETRAKEEARPRHPQRRYSLRLRSLHRLAMTSSSLWWLTKATLLPTSAQRHLRRRQPWYHSLQRSHRLSRAATKPLTRSTDCPRQSRRPPHPLLPRISPRRPSRRHSQRLSRPVMAVAANAGRTSRSSTSSSLRVQRQALPRKQLPQPQLLSTRKVPS